MKEGIKVILIKLNMKMLSWLKRLKH